MARHSRPLPPTPAPGYVVPDSTVPPLPPSATAADRERSAVLTTAVPTADASGLTDPTPASAAGSSSRTAAPDTPSSGPGTRDAAAWPWYRSEPWLAVVVAACLPIGAALVAPERFRYSLIGMSALLVVAGLAMLIRQGLFQSRPGAPPAAKGR